jgi:DNA-binding transcriptional ArsR family regulator
LRTVVKASHDAVTRRGTASYGRAGQRPRLRILLALRAAGELCVGDLAMAAGASDDAVGYGLRTAGLVSFRREGRVVFYRLADGFPGRLLDECELVLGSLAPQASGGGGAR